MALLVAVTALSITWAVEPSGAWIEANRTLSYLATMVAGVALVRLCPAALAVAAGRRRAGQRDRVRLRAADQGLPGRAEPRRDLRAPARAVRLLERRRAHGRRGGAGVPVAGRAALGPRGASARSPTRRSGCSSSRCCSPTRAARCWRWPCGCALWFAVVPLRLRGVAVLATSAFCGGLVAFWAFASNPLSTDNVAAGRSRSAGPRARHRPAWPWSLVLLVAGLAHRLRQRPARALARRAPAGRRRSCSSLLALVPVALVGALALSSRGLGGSLSNGWTNLTDPHANGNISNAPDRLTAVGSVRARYWNEALKIAKAHKALGVGAGGYATVRPRYRNDTLDVRHAHGYVVQTLADLGARRHGRLARAARRLAGGGRAHGRALGARAGARRGRPSAWAWPRCWPSAWSSACTRSSTGRGSSPATPSSRCCARAGWPAAGPPTSRSCGARRRGVAVREPWRIGLAVAAVAVAVVAAWTSWQPQRAVAEGSDALGTRRGAALRPGARADRPAPSGPTRCRSTCSSSRRRSSAPTATRRGARGALQEAVRKRARQPGHLAGAGRVRAQRGPQAPGALGRRLGALPRPALAGGDQTYLQASGRQ